MDAAIVGLIGTLGGVLLGSGGQFTQSSLTRRWQARDQEAGRRAQRREQLWESRRTLYAEFMTTLHGCIATANLAWIANARPADQRGANAPAGNPFDEAIGSISTLLDSVTRQVNEIALIAEGDEVVKAAYRTLGSVTSAYEQAMSRTPDAPEDQWSQMMTDLHSAQNSFRKAARSELSIGS
ncbi:hypothetical protein [Streptomyces sp. NPDC029004]|uniref:hypothetical protein n=1 Tax=Streptomyces sp. NPDC029004 TaxID=3154490 RepID=UPI003404B347